MHPSFRLSALPLAALIATTPAWATNGMNMEGYGPVSTGMGGAAQAMDHGAAAMAQNPATLALGGPGARLDVAIGLLGPDIRSSAGPMSARSGGTSYVMPAFGYVRRNGALTYGFGVFAQGGMGTEYGASTFLAAGSDEPVRSELGVGRVMLPLAWNLTPDFAVGATLDFMWAGLDLRLAAPASDLGALVTGGSGNLAMGLQTLLPTLPAGAWGRIDFSDRSDFTGKAKSTGWAGKLGMVWRASPTFTVGASYQLESSLGDMKTGSDGASLSHELRQGIRRLGPGLPAAHREDQEVAQPTWPGPGAARGGHRPRLGLRHGGLCRADRPTRCCSRAKKAASTSSS
jgi:long-chain fatty acid transport protein